MRGGGPRWIMWIEEPVSQEVTGLKSPGPRLATSSSVPALETRGTWCPPTGQQDGTCPLEKVTLALPSPFACPFPLPPACGQIPDRTPTNLHFLSVFVLFCLVWCCGPCFLRVPCVHLPLCHWWGLSLPGVSLPCLPSTFCRLPWGGWAAYNARLQGLGRSGSFRAPPLHRSASLSGWFLVFTLPPCSSSALLVLPLSLSSSPLGAIPPKPFCLPSSFFPSPPVSHLFSLPPFLLIPSLPFSHCPSLSTSSSSLSPTSLLPAA